MNQHTTKDATQSAAQQATARPAGRVVALFSSLVLAATLILLGLLAGGFVATRVLTTSGMGWDQLADALGGMMVGSLLGLVAAVAAAFLLPSRARWVASGAALVLAALVLIGLRTVDPRTAAPEPAPPPRPAFEPAVTFRLLATGPDVWRASPFPKLAWRRYEVRSENWSLYFETFADPADPAASGQSCAATFVMPSGDDVVAELRRIADAVGELPSDLERCAGNSDGPPSELLDGNESRSILELGWSVGEASSSARLEGPCLRGEVELEALFRLLVELQQTLPLTCEPEVGVG